MPFRSPIGSLPHRKPSTFPGQVQALNVRQWLIDPGISTCWIIVAFFPDQGMRPLSGLVN
jgi:hypothetical protein